MESHKRAIKMRSIFAGGLIATGLVLAPNVSAQVVSISASGSFISVTGGYVTDGMSVGQGYSSTFTFDTNYLNASHYTLIPGQEQNDAYTAAYTFSGGPYGMSATADGAGGSFTTAQVEVRVFDNVFISAGAGAGIIQADGYYDLMELMGSQTTASYCPLPLGCTETYEYAPSAGEEVGLILVGNSSWFSGGALPVIPNNPSALLWATTTAGGVETGNILGSVNSSTVSTVPVPAAAWLLGSGLLGLIGVARRKAA